VNQTFNLQAEPSGNDTSSPSGKLNLLFASCSGSPAETGLSIASDGKITFATGQTFPGTGTITGVTAGSGLCCSGTSGNVSLAVDSTVARTNAANTFGANQTVNGTLTATSFTGSGAGLTNLPAANLSGSIADANLPSDVVRLGASNAFTNLQSISFTSASPALSVSNLSASGTAVYGNGGQAGVSGNGGAYGIYGSSSGAYGVYGTSGYIGVYGTSSGGASAGVYGNATGSSSPGVYGNSSLYYGVYGNGTTGIYGNSNGSTGVSGNGGSQGTGVSGSGLTGVSGSGSYGVYGSSTNGFGLVGSSGYIGVEGTGTTYGVYGLSETDSGYGVYAVNDASDGNGLALLAIGGTLGVEGFGQTGVTGLGNGSSIGTGLFGDANGGSYGVYSNGNFAVSAGSTKSAMAVLPDDRSVLLYTIESPENWFEDFGSGQLQGGAATIELDSIFAQTVSPEAGYHVFLTPNGDCEGLYVAQKTATGFEVRELHRGKSNVAFDYRIVAKRKGLESLRMEEVSTDHDMAEAMRQQLADRPSHPPKLQLPKVQLPKALPEPAPPALPAAVPPRG
jgi:hypothetical protein